MKVCSSCRRKGDSRPKPDDAFYPDNRLRGGLMSECKECRKEMGHKQYRDKVLGKETVIVEKKQKTVLNCEHCHNEFEVWPCHSSQRFCSWNCRFVGMRGPGFAREGVRL